MSHIMKGYNRQTESLETVCVVRNRVTMIPNLAVEVYEGALYTHTTKQTVASLATLDHVISVGSGEHRLEEFEFATTASPSDVYLYKAPFFDVNSAGTEHTFINQNRESPNVIDSQIFENPFIDANSIGIQLEYSLNPAVSGGNNKEVGGGAGGLHEWALKPNTNYLVRFINQDPSNEATVGVMITMVDE